MSKKEEYQKKYRNQLDLWEIEIKKLSVHANKLKDEAQLQYLNEIERLRKLQHSAQQKLDELQMANEEAWKDLKSGIEKSWESLEDAVKSAASKFK